jgi:hypothetical protein
MKTSSWRLYQGPGRVSISRAHLSGVPVLGRTRSLDWQPPTLD